MDTVLFIDDQKKIENAVEYHAVGSYQIGEVARMSALLYDRGIDVIKELEKLHHKFGLDDYEYMKRDLKTLQRIYKTYNMMKDLLEEMDEHGDLVVYNVEEIFNRIKEHEKEVIFYSIKE